MKWIMALVVHIIVFVKGISSFEILSTNVAGMTKVEMSLYVLFHMVSN